MEGGVTVSQSSPGSRAGSAPHRRRVSARPRRVPTSVRWLTALWGALLVGASLVWPMMYGYDEPAQIDMARVYAAEPFHFYAPGALGITAGLRGAQNAQPGFPPTAPLGTTAIPDRDARQTFEELGGDALTPLPPPNQMIQHPPLYYWVEAVVTRVPGVSGLAWDVEVWLMRLLSCLMVLPVPALCYLATRRLLGTSSTPQGETPDTDTGAPPEPTGWVHSVSLLAALVPFSLASLVRDGSSVNNDCLLILAASVLLYAVCRVLGGDLSLRTGAIVAVALAVALNSKGFALVLPLVVLAAYVVAALRTEHRDSPRWRRALPALGLAALGGVVGSWWWVRNLLVFHTVQTSGAGPGYEESAYGPRNFSGSLSTFVPTYFSQLLSRIWGGIGLPDSPSLGPVPVYGWPVLVLVGLLCALLVRHPGPGRRGPLVLVSAVVLTVALPAYGSWLTNRDWGQVYAGTSGRYLFHVVVALAVCAAVGWARVLRPRAASLLAPWVLAGGLLTNAAAWLLLLGEWYGPDNQSGPGLVTASGSALLRWAPTPAALTVVLVVVLPLVLGVAALVVLVREARGEAPRRSSPPRPTLVEEPV